MAMAQGGSLTINPHTGLVEANWLTDSLSAFGNWLSGGGGGAAAAAADTASTVGDTAATVADTAATVGDAASTLAELEPVVTNATKVADVAGNLGSGAKALAEAAPAASSGIAGISSVANTGIPDNLFGPSSLSAAGYTAEDLVPKVTPAASAEFTPELSHLSNADVLKGDTIKLPGYGNFNLADGTQHTGLEGIGSKINNFLSNSTNKSLLQQLIPLVGNMISGGNKLNVNDPNKPVFWNQHQQRVVNPRYGEPGQPYFIMEQSPGYFSSNYIAPGQMTTANGQGTFNNPYKGLSALPTPRKFVSGGVIKNFAAGGLTFNTFDPATAAMAMPAPPPPSTAMDAYLAPMMASTYDPTLRPFLPSSVTSSQTSSTGSGGGAGGGQYGPYGPGGAGNGSSGSSGSSTGGSGGGSGSSTGSASGAGAASGAGSDSWYGKDTSTIGQGMDKVQGFNDWNNNNPWKSLGLGLAVPGYGLLSAGSKAASWLQNAYLANKLSKQNPQTPTPGEAPSVRNYGINSNGIGQNMSTDLAENYTFNSAPTISGKADFSNMDNSPMATDGSLGDPLSGRAHGGPIHHDGLGSLGYNTYAAGGKLLRGHGDGMSDSIPAIITGHKPQQAALADGEFVIPADVVSHLGNGSTEAGSRKLYSMMHKVRKARTGNPKQGKQINPDKFVPA
jgi:hypothetical protein